MATSIIKARRRLDELFKTGVEIRFGGPYGRQGAIADGGHGEFKDEDGKPLPADDDVIVMWVQPPSPTHREIALRDANAARARALVAAKRDEDSQEYLSILAFLADMSDETLYDYVLNAEADNRRNDAIREVLAEEEWKDITAYQDAMRTFEEEGTPEDDPEYAAMLELDRKFADQVSVRERELRDAAYDVLRMLGRQKAEKRALERRSEIVGSQAFMREYERKMTYFSVRDPENHGVLFFESARELADQPDEVRNLVGEALEPFISDGGEAKNSPRAASGSDSSEPPNKPETSEVSTPQESNE